MYVFQRPVGADSWSNMGHTCWPELVPGPHTPTLAQIADAFHKTPFAKPLVHIQPEGNRTLVTLPTYFEASWSTTGYEPNEIDHLPPGEWWGLEILVKPLLQDLVYNFGDGTAYGPTTDTGGPYPTGDITKTYDKGGVYSVRVDATLLGQFSINGSEWMDIEGHADVPGIPTDLTVLTARNHLYTPAGG